VSGRREGVARAARQAGRAVLGMPRSARLAVIVAAIAVDAPGRAVSVQCGEQFEILAPA